MRITNIEINNFKFHKKLKFNIEKQNCLIYGENGTGKSSIYWALYSKFKNLNMELYKNYDNNQIPIINLKYDKHDIENFVNNNQSTIYFINQEILDDIIYKEENKYSIFERYLSNHFGLFKKIHDKYKSINEEINSENIIDKIKLQNENDKKYRHKLKDIELKSNDIIKKFGEKFIISFDFIPGVSDTINDYKFSNPTIFIRIDDKNSIKYYFNEAKLKLTSMAIYFALIMIEENRTNPFKLLVLDDFLTSLDMANRHYIIEYIFSTFNKYQKIILTHNLQFNNLIIDLINENNRNNKWDIFNIYTRYENDELKSIIYKSNNNYLETAKNKFQENDLQSCGNLLRKEFERIVHELEKFYSIGRIEETAKVLELIIHDKPIYNKQNELMNRLTQSLKHCKDLSNDMQTKQIKTI